MAKAEPNRRQAAAGSDPPPDYDHYLSSAGDEAGLPLKMNRPDATRHGYSPIYRNGEQRERQPGNLEFRRSALWCGLLIIAWLEPLLGWAPASVDTATLFAALSLGAAGIYQLGAAAPFVRQNGRPESLSGRFP
ncbi:MAG: hypothetical protein WBR13_08600 [Allosphingosinicella sp.]